MGRTPFHYAGGKHDGGHMYELLKEAGGDETIKDIVSLQCVNTIKSMLIQLAIFYILSIVSCDDTLQICLSFPVQVNFLINLANFRMKINYLCFLRIQSETDDLYVISEWLHTKRLL